MTKGKTVPAPAVTEAKKPLTDQQRIEAFQAEYLELCKKHGLTHVFRPDWRQSLDTGTYSLSIQTTIAKFNGDA